LLINSVLIKGINIRTNLILPRRIVIYFRKNKKNNKKISRKKPSIIIQQINFITLNKLTLNSKAKILMHALNNKLDSIPTVTK